jgi:hypothetical protein
MLAPSNGYGFEPCVHAERPEQVPHVVPHRLRAEVELLRDLFRRVTAL